MKKKLQSACLQTSDCKKNRKCGNGMKYDVDRKNGGSAYIGL